MFSPLTQYDIINYFKGSITNMIYPIIFVLFFIISFIILFLKEFAILPKLWQFSFEAIFLFIINIIKQQIGKKGFIYFPIIFTFFLAILGCNLLSLTPFSVALTSHISIIAFLTFTINIAIFLKGFIINKSQFLILFVPTSPLLLLFLLVPIEIFSYAIRPLSMAIRLVANIIAGHTLVSIVSSFLLKLFNLKFFFFINVLIIIFAIFVLELGVAFLQAYVFVVLLCIYLSECLNLPAH